MLRSLVMVFALLAAGLFVLEPATAERRHAPSGLICHQGLSGLPDLRLTGRINTLENLSAYDTTDGSCGGAALDPGTAASGTYEDALRKCRRIGDFTEAIAVASVWPTVPSDWYICIVT